MGLSNLLGVLSSYAGGAASNAPPNTEQDFQNVSAAIPQQHLASGLAQAFHSSQTPPFPEMLSTLFSHSNPDQKAGILGRLLSAAGPAGIGALGGLIPGLSPNSTQLNPQQSAQVPPSAVRQLAEQAQSTNPSIVEEASSFYSQHPQVVQALGAGALALIMSHVSQRL